MGEIGVGGSLGRVYIQIVQGIDLDIPVKTTGAYCKLAAYIPSDEHGERRRYKTKKVSVAGGEGPSWKESFTVEFKKPFSLIEFEVWCVRPDSGSHGRGVTEDEVCVGRFVVPLTYLADQVAHRDSFQLRTTEGSGYAPGKLEVHLHFKYVPMWADAYSAAHALEKKSWHVAMRYIRQALTNIPQEIELVRYRSIANMNMQKYSDALVDARLVVERSPTWSGGYVTLGLVHMNMNELDKASEVFRAGLKHSPSDESLRAVMAEVERLLRSTQLVAAVREARDAFIIGDTVKSENALNKAITNNDSNYILYLLRSVVRTAAGKRDEAEKDAVKVVTLHADWVKENWTRQGYLEKRGGLNKLMKRRWFILKNKFLFYFNDDKETQPNGVLVMHEVQVEVRENRPRELSVIVGKRTFELRAQSEDERDSWAISLRGAMADRLRYPEAEMDNVSLAQVESANTPVLSNRNNHRGSMSKPANQNTVKISIKKQDFAGYMHMEGETPKSWERYWFIKRANVLFVFEVEQPENPQNVIPKWAMDNLNLATLRIVSQQLHTFEMVWPQRMIRLRVDKADEFEEWTISLGLVCMSASGQLDISSMDLLRAGGQRMALYGPRGMLAMPAAQGEVDDSAMSNSYGAMPNQPSRFERPPRRDVPPVQPPARSDIPVKFQDGNEEIDGRGRDNANGYEEAPDTEALLQNNYPREPDDYSRPTDFHFSSPTPSRGWCGGWFCSIQ